MQCVPVYYHAKDLNVCANGSSWHLLNVGHNYVESRGTNVLFPSYTPGKYLGYDKDVLRQIIQNHDATFRFQVAELHRVYKKQKELMDEMKSQKIFTQSHLQTLESNHTLSQSRSNSCKSLLPYATSCLIEDSADGKMSMLSNGDVPKRPFFVAGKFQETTTVNFSPFLAKTSFKGVESPPFQRKRHGIKSMDFEIPAYLGYDSGKQQFEEESSNAGPVILDVHPHKKMRFFIDLNEPVLHGSMTSSSSAPFEPCVEKIVSVSSSFSGEEAQLEPVLHKHYGHVCCEGSSAEKTSSLDIDLNSTPLSCISETDITFESIENMNEEIKVGDPDNVGITSVEEMNLKDHSSTHTGIFKDLGIKNPHFSKRVERESAMELDMIGAETLILISALRNGDYTKNSSLQPEGISNGTLCWFADIVASLDQGIEAITMEQSLQQAGHGVYVKEEKETDQMVGSSKRDRVNRTRQRKNSRKTGLLKRNASKNACAAPGKCCKLQHLDVIQNSVDSKLRRQPLSHDKRGLLQKCLDGWGKMRKRGDGHRRPACKFLVIS